MEISQSESMSQKEIQTGIPKQANEQKEIRENIPNKLMSQKEIQEGIPKQANEPKGDTGEYPR